MAVVTPERFVNVRVLYRFRTNLPEKDLVEFVASCRVAVESKMLEAWHSSDAADVIAGRGLTLSILGVVGPSELDVVVVPSMVDTLREEMLERWNARVGDSVADEVSYLRQRDEEATERYEAAKEAGIFEYEPERDPLQGETSSRYEEGQMP